MSSPTRIETAIEISPLTVLVRGVLEWACPHAFFEELFDRLCRPQQWNRKLTISAIAWLMLTVVSGVRRSVFAAFVADQASPAPTLLATAAALYAKYGRIDPRYTTAVVRESGGRMQDLLTAAGVEGPFGWVETGEVWEQPIEVEETEHGQRRRLRRIILVLDIPTEEGDTEIVLLSNLRGICPLRICRLYRDRWRIERHFALVKTVLRGEIEGLGRPRAAIFAMGMALVAANALAVVKQALRVTHGVEEVEKLSGYYLADEVAGNYRAVDVLVAASEWESLGSEPAAAFWGWCLGVGARVRTRG